MRVGAWAQDQEEQKGSLESLHQAGSPEIPVHILALLLTHFYNLWGFSFPMCKLGGGWIGLPAGSQA